MYTSVFMFYIVCSVLWPSWSWSYDSWIYNYLCNQCLLPLKLGVRIPVMVKCLDTTLSDKICQWLTTCRWFSPGTPVSCANNNWPPRYNWNIIKSGVKHHNPNHYTLYYNFIYLRPLFSIALIVEVAKTSMMARER